MINFSIINQINIQRLKLINKISKLIKLNNKILKFIEKNSINILILIRKNVRN